MVHSGTALLNPHKVFEKIKLGERMRVADFGCGSTGHFVFPSAQIVGEKGVVYAIDILKSVLDGIRSMVKSEGYDNVQTVWSDIELVGKTAIPANSLDACFFVNVLFQLKDHHSAIREATRLLKKNGFLVIIDWTKKLGPLGPAEDKMITSQSVEEIAKENGLNLFDKAAMNDYHYLLIFKKLV